MTIKRILVVVGALAVIGSVSVVGVAWAASTPACGYVTWDAGGQFDLSAELVNEGGGGTNVYAAYNSFTIRNHSSSAQVVVLEGVASLTTGHLQLQLETGPGSYTNILNTPWPTTIPAASGGTPGSRTFTIRSYMDENSVAQNRNSAVVSFGVINDAKRYFGWQVCESTD